MKLFQFLLSTNLLLGSRVQFLIILMVVNAFFEGLALTLLLPMLQMLSGDKNQSEEYVFDTLYTIFAFFGLTPTPLSVAFLIVALLIVSAMVALILAHFQISLQAEYVARLQSNFFSTFAYAKWPFIRKQSDGEIISAITVEAQRAGGAFYQLCLIFSVSIFVSIQFIVALLVAPKVTIAVIASAFFLYVITQPFVRRALQLGEELTQQNSKLQSAATELITAMKLVKSGSAEKVAITRMNRVIEAVRNIFHKSNLDLQVVRIIFEYGSGIFITIVLVISSTNFGTGIEELIVILAIFGRLFPKITALRQCLQSIELVLPAVARLETLTNTAKEELEQQIGNKKLSLTDKAIGIEIKELTVLSEDGSRLLDNINLSISPGEIVALIGHSGAGKTTLVDAILGMVKNSHGEILINGTPLHEINLYDWRHHIGYMGQDAQLFDDTIEANILWRTPNVTREEFIRTAQAAAVDHFVTPLQTGYNTSVGSRGARLSGGERQRVALARALLGKPSLLILDEATSALDSKIEALVMETILKLKGHVTILVITHRLSSIHNCDRVITLSKGKIIGDICYDEYLIHHNAPINFS